MTAGGSAASDEADAAGEVDPGGADESGADDEADDDPGIGRSGGRTGTWRTRSQATAGWLNGCVTRMTTTARPATARLPRPMASGRPRLRCLPGGRHPPPGPPPGGPRPPAAQHPAGRLLVWPGGSRARSGGSRSGRAVPAPGRPAPPAPSQRRQPSWSRGRPGAPAPPGPAASALTGGAAGRPHARAELPARPERRPAPAAEAARPRRAVLGSLRHGALPATTDSPTDQ